MYFTLADLCKLNNMYRISLESFNRLFEKTLISAPYKGDSTDKRNKALRYGSCAYLVDQQGFSTGLLTGI